MVYVYWVGGKSDICGDRMMIGGEVVPLDLSIQRLKNGVKEM